MAVLRLVFVSVALLVFVLIPVSVLGASPISYAAISHGDGTTCKGAENCREVSRPGPPANPYSRGCSEINRCRGGQGRKMLGFPQPELQLQT